jgi:hypothetical protein
MLSRGNKQRVTRAIARGGAARAFTPRDQVAAKST